MRLLHNKCTGEFGERDSMQTFLKLKLSEKQLLNLRPGSNYSEQWEDSYGQWRLRTRAGRKSGHPCGPCVSMSVILNGYLTNRKLFKCLFAAIATWMTSFQPEERQVKTRGVVECFLVFCWLKWHHSCFYHSTETWKLFSICFIK